MLVKSRHPEPPPATRKIANAFRILDWVAFWVQLVMAFIAGIALIFTATGRIFSPDTSAGTGVDIFWAACGILLLVAGIIFDLQRATET
jgi:hypothetical protein